jgi:hypothetical protein
VRPGLRFDLALDGVLFRAREVAARSCIVRVEAHPIIGVALYEAGEILPLPLGCEDARYENDRENQESSPHGWDSTPLQNSVMANVFSATIFNRYARR